MWECKDLQFIFNRYYIIVLASTPQRKCIELKEESFSIHLEVMPIFHDPKLD